MSDELAIAKREGFPFDMAQGPKAREPEIAIELLEEALRAAHVEPLVKPFAVRISNHFRAYVPVAPGS